jgi:hypothetical protein
MEVITWRNDLQYENRIVKLIQSSSAFPANPTKRNAIEYRGDYGYER